MVQVDVLGRSDFSAKSKIGTDGKIQLPLLGRFPPPTALSLQLREDIGQALQKGGFFTKPIVEVVVVSYASRYVTVLGAVGVPALFRLTGPIGFRKFWPGWAASGIAAPIMSCCAPRKVSGITRSRIWPRAISISIPMFNPATRFSRPTADIFYIKGQVKGPGGYGLIPHMTLVMAMARGGGITDLGSDSHIKIMRKNVTISPKDLNVEVLPDDVIDVGEGWF